MPKVSLRDVVIKTERVPIDEEKDEWFEVRGVSLADMLIMLKMYTDDMEMLFSEFMRKRESGDELSIGLFTDLATTAVERTPHLLYKIIAVAADEPDSVDMIAKLRAPVQFFALSKILALSITSEIELKKMVEGLTKGLGWVATLRKQLSPAMMDFGAGFSNAARQRPN